jgi:hypothetical protein
MLDSVRDCVDPTFLSGGLFFYSSFQVRREREGEREREKERERSEKKISLLPLLCISRKIAEAHEPQHSPRYFLIGQFLDTQFIHQPRSPTL